MRIPALAVIALCAIGATEPPAESRDAYMPGYTEPASKWTSIDDATDPANCGDRIQQVRDASGQPKLDREPAKADEPLLIAAVDHRIDGCPVMVMRNDINDVRPLPAPSETTGVIPAQ